MIEQLITRTFQARDIAHRAHWKTKSFAEHMALGEFYDAVIDKIDDIVETYQGQYGLVGTFGVKVEAMGQSDITAFLTAEAEWIEANRDEIAKGSTAIENLLDNLLETYNRTLYKLVNLS